MGIFHQPVLLKEVIKILDLKEGKNIIDATCGAGGHTKEIAKKISPSGKILAIDWDQNMLKKAKANVAPYQKMIIFKQGNFAEIKNIINANYSLKKISWQGILFDFGFSMDQIKASGRGFSFLKDEPLDMRYDLKNNLTAEKILNNYSFKKLSEIFLRYGEEKKARQIANLIIKSRKENVIKKTSQLNEIIFKVYSKSFYKIHPATKIYQALRIAVNNELNNIKKGLSDGFDILSSNGILVAITFHSLESRLVKNFFKEKQKLNEGKILTKKAVKPSLQEISSNPASRSANLRAIMKIL